MAIDSVIGPVLNTVLDAVVVMDRGGIVRAWNAHAEMIFGWPAGEAIGRNLDQLIIPPALRQAHRRGLQRFNNSGEARILDRRVELTGLRKDGTEFPLELSITLAGADGEEAFVGFLRDISDKKEAEQRLERQLRESRLMLELSELANRHGGFEDALAATLDAICELADWPVGHAFLVEEDGRSLKSSVWNSDARETAPSLVGATESAAFRIGTGLPGKVLQSREPFWVSRLDKSGFPRRGLGFEAAFAFPVFSGGSCIAIMEFFSRRRREPDEALLLSVRAVGAQVGRVFERIRAEELRTMLVNELNHRAKNMLAVVRGMAHLSFGSATDVEEAQRMFNDRLDAIANANAIIHQGTSRTASLGAVIREGLSGCGATEERVKLAGPALQVDGSSAIMISLAVHELCTNAFKYGALSAEGGCIDVEWAVSPKDAARFDFSWKEHGGPPAAAPSRTGFGTRILKRGLELETGGKAELSYGSAGLRYSLTGARHKGLYVADSQTAARATAGA
jgi:PAS domain S-box-containing protein